MISRAIRVALLPLVLCCVSQRALAQEGVAPGTRPYRGLFAAGDPNPPHRLGVTWSAFGVRDGNLTADTRSFSPMTQLDGSYGDASMTLTYISRKDRFSILANGTGNGRYYNRPEQLTQFGGNGNITLSFDLGRNKETKISIFQATSYQPYFQLNFLNILPSQPTAAAANAGSPQYNALTNRDSREYDGVATLVRSWGTRTTLSFDYNYRHTTLSDSPAPFRWQLGTATFRRKLTKYAALRLGYGYGQARDGTVSTAPTVVNQNIDIGMDYARPLSFSRRTTITFSSGSSIVSDGVRQYFRVLADAGLTREIGRSWALTGNYHRGVQYVEGIVGPLYADTAQMRAHGLITRRIDLGVSGAYTNGEIGLSAVANDYVSYTGAVDLHIALSSMLSISTQYAYYYYDFNQATVIPGVPGTLRRNSLRVGLSGWFGRTR
jgi:hypothetical protein